MNIAVRGPQYGCWSCLVADCVDKQTPKVSRLSCTYRAIIA
jgi:hypothetical protein